MLVASLLQGCMCTPTCVAPARGLQRANVCMFDSLSGLCVCPAIVSWVRFAASLSEVGRLYNPVGAGQVCCAAARRVCTALMAVPHVTQLVVVWGLKTSLSAW